MQELVITEKYVFGPYEREALLELDEIIYKRKEQVSHRKFVDIMAGQGIQKKEAENAIQTLKKLDYIGYGNPIFVKGDKFKPIIILPEGRIKLNRLGEEINSN